MWPPSRRACTPSAATWGEQPALRGFPPASVGRRAPGPRWRHGRERERERAPGVPRAWPLAGAWRGRVHSRRKFQANKWEEAPVYSFQHGACSPSAVFRSRVSRGMSAARNICLIFVLALLYKRSCRWDCVGEVNACACREIFLVVFEAFCLKKQNIFWGSGYSVASKPFKNDHFITKTCQPGKLLCVNRVV